MKGVEAQHRLGCPLGSHGVDPLRAVSGDVGQQRGAVFAQGVEETPQRRGVTALGGPHQPAGVMIDHAEQIPVALAVADLIDPDPAQPIQPVDLTHPLGHHWDDDRGHRTPGDPQQRRQHAQRGMAGQPRRSVFKRAGEPGPMARPGHRGDDHTVVAQLTLGAAACRYTRVVLASRPRHRRGPSPLSYRGARRSHRPHRPCLHRVGRTVATSTSSPPCASSSTFSITVCCTPSTDRHTLTARNAVPS
jgi:hypothetical protein